MTQLQDNIFICLWFLFPLPPNPSGLRLTRNTHRERGRRGGGAGASESFSAVNEKVNTGENQSILTSKAFCTVSNFEDRRQKWSAWQLIKVYHFFTLKCSVVVQDHAEKIALARGFRPNALHGCVRALSSHTWHSSRQTRSSLLKYCIINGRLCFLAQRHTVR